ncbi:hypothetical protein EDD18DRAFT_1181324 [Armillaria luteobubalina]|uniref:Uncharacterized protein n=1 Tax=Armillaria luteobubalina TaxID=153913 RepID=A0AA39UU29_9AGAR|nr:hypothetical protein EDD18DRAFT_1181324 [Armillaria luteobubalina]
MDKTRNPARRLRGKPPVVHEAPSPIPRLTSSQNLYTDTSETANEITRHRSRPCLCGIYGSGGCKWQFFYPYQMIIAIHEVLQAQDIVERLQGPPTPPPKPRSDTLTGLQKRTFFVTPSRTNEDPTFAIIKSSSYSSPTLEGGAGPWVESQGDGKLVCFGCGCGYDSSTWPEHRDSCLGIDDAILRSVVDTWEIEARVRMQS